MSLSKPGTELAVEDGDTHKHNLMPGSQPVLPPEFTPRVRVSGFWVPKMEAQTRHFQKT